MQVTFDVERSCLAENCRNQAFSLIDLGTALAPGGSWFGPSMSVMAI